MFDSNTSSTREVNIQPQILSIMERDTRYTLANWTAAISKLWTYWKLNLKDIFCYFYFQESKNPCALFVIISLWRPPPPKTKKTQPWINPANSLHPCHCQPPAAFHPTGCLHKINQGAGRWNGIFMKGCTPRLPPTLQVAKVCAESVPITCPPGGGLVPRWWVFNTENVSGRTWGPAIYPKRMRRVRV